MFIKINSTSSIKSLLTHVGNLCRIASRARAVEEIDVSPDDELSSSSTREGGNILYHGHVDLILLDPLCPKNCIIQTERTFDALKLTTMKIFNILVDSVALD